MLNKNPFGVGKILKTGHEVWGTKHVKVPFEIFYQKWSTSSPSVSMMQASNGKTSNFKVVDIFKMINLDSHFASFGFFMRKLWALEVGHFQDSIVLVQSDL